MKNPIFIRILCRLNIPPRPFLLCIFDLIALLGTAITMLSFRHIWGGIDLTLSQCTLVLLLLGPFFAATLGLYHTVDLPPHLELKALFTLATSVYAIILAVLFLTKTGDLFSRLTIIGGWGLTIITLPLMRWLCRRIFSRAKWWATTLVILDKDGQGQNMFDYFSNNPGFNLHPTAIYPIASDIETLRHSIAAIKRKHPNALPLLSMSLGARTQGSCAVEISRHFRRVLFVPTFYSSLLRAWLTPCDLGKVGGLVLQQKLRDKWRIYFKRTLDLIGYTLGSVVLIPLGLLLVLIIRLDSPGPAFYRQKRLGQGGRTILIYKFRTMVPDSERVLRRILAEDSSLREEWAKDHKLKNDPRITRVGNFLRKYSLDELPQLLNVLKGEMSLVGPRPIVESEVEKYKSAFEDYCLVRPGITGLWQISGRNNTSYTERVYLDSYYVNNWSVWLDWWILIKTIPVILGAKGAY